MKFEDLKEGDIFQEVFEGNVHSYIKILKIRKKSFHYVKFCYLEYPYDECPLIFNKQKREDPLWLLHGLIPIEKVPPEKGISNILYDFDWVLGGFCLPLDSNPKSFTYHYNFLNGCLERRKKRE